MITLYTFGPAFGLPDPSPFVMKAADAAQAREASNSRRTPRAFLRAPKGKLPYIDDNGTIVADSTLIRLHLEQKHGIDFDRGLSTRDRGIAWATEKMLEDHLYWVLVYWRWMNDANFERGPANFFKRAPAFIRPLVKMESARQRTSQSACPRHQPSQRGRDDGHVRSGLRCAVAASRRQPVPDGQRGLRCRRHRVCVRRRCDVRRVRIAGARQGAHLPNLAAYRDRMMAEFYPEMGTVPNS